MNVLLKYLTCERTKTGEQEEEPYLTVRDGFGEEFRWGPFHMRDGDSLRLNSVCYLEPTHHLSLTLRESDTPGMGTSSRDEEIDTFQISANHPTGSFNAFFGVDLSGAPLFSPNTRTRAYRLFYDVMENMGDLEEYCLDLRSLRCLKARETTDEVFINVDGRRVWGPQNIKRNQTLSINIRGSITVKTPVWIQMWERDSSTRNDAYGTHIFNINDDFDFGGHREAAFNHFTGSNVGTAAYVLHFRVIRKRHMLGRRCGDE